MTKRTVPEDKSSYFSIWEDEEPPAEGAEAESASEEETETELSVEQLLQSNPEPQIENIDVENKSETRRMIEKFVDENPEAAAALLRNWLTDDWG